MIGQFARFLLTGGVSAIVNLLSRYVLNLAMSFQMAVVVAGLIGMTTGYALARKFVFETSGRSMASEYKRFAVVGLLALILVWSVSVGLARVVFPMIGFTAWYADDVAHLIGVLVPAIASFLGHRAYTFERAG